MSAGDSPRPLPVRATGEGTEQHTDAQENVANHSDGGRNALAGFLFQMLQVGRVALFGLEGVQSDAEEVNALVLHEAFGQDAAVTGAAGGVALVQYKYSRTADKTITKADLLEIADRFVKSEQKVQGAGYHVTEVRLVTNRRKGARLDAALETLRENQLTATEVEQMAVRIDYLVVESSAACRDITQFLEGYGAFQAEVDNALYAWLGQLLQQSASSGDVVVLKEDLLRFLLGVPDPRQLRLPDLLPRLREEIEDFRAEYALRPTRPVHRDIARDIAAEVASVSRPIVVVSGTGGVGKTTALAEFVELRLEPETGSPTAMLAAQSPEANGGVSELVRRWAGLTAPAARRNDDRPEQAVERLAVANPDLPRPYLCLCLDGADEAPELNKEHARSIIQSFLRLRTREDEPTATLVISCRDERALLREFFPYDLTTGESTFREYGHVQVGTFDHGEFDEALAAITSDVAARLRLPPSASDGVPGSLTGHLPTATFGTAASTGTADMEVAAALRHPVVWRAFADLSAEMQHAVLDGDESALDDVADQILKWFCAKAARRSRDFLDSETHVRHGLALAAERTLRRSSWKELDWSLPVIEIYDRGFASALYREAVSAGLVEHAASASLWTHHFVPEMLIRTHRDHL